MLSKRFTTTLLVSALCVEAAACASPTADSGIWHDVPRPTFLRIDQHGSVSTTLAQLTVGERTTLVHCMHVTLLTMPSRARLIFHNAFEDGIAGGAGEGAGILGEGATYGVHVATKVVTGDMAFGFLANIFFGAARGNDEYANLFRSGTEACRKSQAAGLYTMGPDERNELVKDLEQMPVGTVVTRTVTGPAAYTPPGANGYVASTWHVAAPASTQGQSQPSNTMPANGTSSTGFPSSYNMTVTPRR